MTGVLYILLCWLAGTLLSRLLGGYVSGNIIGMVLLFAGLTLKWIPAESVRPAAKWLLGVMAIFFVPYGVGLMVSYHLLLDNLWAIIISLVISTVVVVIVSGRCYQAVNLRMRARRIKNIGRHE